MKLASYGTYGLHIINNPAGTFSFVGTIPDVMCIDKKNTIGLPYRDTPIFKTEAEAIEYFESKKHLITL